MKRELVQIHGAAELNRRDLLRVLAGGVAALEVGCLAEPGEAVLPYVSEPPEARPGVPVRYASTLTSDGYAQGVIVETRDGRPIKLDGNPAHPDTLGGSTPALQARILDLYDPQRGRAVTIRGEPVGWERVRAALAAVRGRAWLVMPPTSSQTIASLLDRVRARADLHVVWDAPLGRREALRGHAMALGAVVEPQHDLARADLLVALDADWTRSPALARAAAAQRSRLRIWACEPAPTASGSLADERLAIPARDVAAIAAALAGDGPGGDWVRRLRGELARGRAAVFVGDRQPANVHALGRVLDRVATYTPCPLVDPLGGHTLADLATALRAHEVDAVIFVDTNPVYTAPRALELARLVADAPLSLHVGLHPDETSRVCAAYVPLAHELEAWADARAHDGTRSLGQPVIRPRAQVASAIDVLAALAGERRPPLQLVREASRLDERAWRAALARGIVEGSAERPRSLAAKRVAEAQAAAPVGPAVGPIEIALAPSHVHDGRFAANAWLQELPHPITKQTWGNAALMSPATAAALGASDGQLVRVETAAGHVELPAIVVIGCADRSITVELGYGRLVPELPIAHAVGADAYRLRGGEALLLTGRGIALDRRRELARTQHNFTEQGREVAPTSLDVAARLRGPQPSLLPEPSHAGWGMTIDTAICTGCSACMVACQAENNIPIVGAEQVRRGRHMNWLRVDRYLVDEGDVVNQPVACQHCENAPCEYVCPVEATVHSPDGLNEMVYNRCVGTRFCSNNCPYKVRRFNWFAFERDDSTRLQYNPDVTVRSRGVMEKCTYCVQRIRRAEITARVRGGDGAIREGEVVTACMQACPTGAIQFGNLAERSTPFAASRTDPRRYDLLHDLGTRPRTIYLAKVRK
jgi:molybdopterin-containing oxidoreductase family iron-sulfur binding subunit